MIALLISLLWAQQVDLDGLRSKAGTPGVAMAIVKDGRAEFKTSGVVSVEGQVPVTPDTLFRIASTTKMFTAAALASLAVQGKVDLHKPIGSYCCRSLPAKLQTVTLHQLLTHTAGIADDAPMDGPHDDSALEARVKAFGEDMILASPGRVFSYTNAGYALAGYVLEQTYGKPFADAVRDLVLEPCGMRTSTFRPLLAMTYPLAIGHHPSASGTAVVRPFADHAGAWPAGSLFTSAREYARFLMALLDDGKIEGKQALPSEVVKLLTTGHVDIPGIGRKYGYGFQVFKEGETRVLRHTGGRIGYESVVHLLPDQRTGVVILANRTGSSFFALSRQVAEQTAGARSAPGSALPEGSTISETEAAKLAGRYFNSKAIVAELAVRDGTLKAQVSNRWIAVTRIGVNRFQALGAGPLSDFQIMNDANGNPEFLVAEVWALRRLP